VDPAPDLLLLRKSGSAGNRTEDLWVEKGGKEAGGVCAMGTTIICANLQTVANEMGGVCSASG
jgi:hypothetical protein